MTIALLHLEAETQHILQNESFPAILLQKLVFILLHRGWKLNLLIWNNYCANIISPSEFSSAHSESIWPISECKSSISVFLPLSMPVPDLAQSLMSFEWVALGVSDGITLLLCVSYLHLSH